MAWIVLIFAGLAVSLAYHAGLFNIGPEGQAYVGGLGVILIGLALNGMHWGRPIAFQIAAATSGVGLGGIDALAVHQNQSLAALHAANRNTAASAVQAPDHGYAGEVGDGILH